MSNQLRGNMSDFDPSRGSDLSREFKQAMENYNRDNGTDLDQAQFDILYSPSHISHVIRGHRGQTSPLRYRVIEFIRKFG